MKISSAILSVADKTGLPELAKALAQSGANIFATGGTAKILAQNNLPVQDLAQITGDAEILNGRVKTLNTNLHASVLANPQNSDHAAELQKRGIPQVQLVAVNFYPFAQVANAGASEEDIIENIDIGGPALVRAAAKGGRVVLSNPAQYPAFIAALKDGVIPHSLVQEFIAQAFAEVAQLDADIANHFAQKNAPDPRAPDRVFIPLRKSGELRYGENPHQPAARYVVGGASDWKLAGGGALSYNNILDAQSAWRAVAALGERPAAVVVKHNNPCGAATADSLCAAFEKARRGDPLSAFGGVAALNKIADSETARALSAMFLEVIVAPGFSEEALQIFAGKERPRLAIPPSSPARDSEWRIADGTALSQIPDFADEVSFEIKSKRQPDEAELRALHFAWKIAAALKSNAIAFARGTMLAGAGAGQSSRVDAAVLARDKMARAELTDDEKSMPLVAASDGFFPFPDAARVLLESGATAILHPGGAKRDDEIAQVADEFGAALAIAGRRHFRHYK